MKKIMCAVAVLFFLILLGLFVSRSKKWTATNAGHTARHPTGRIPALERNKKDNERTGEIKQASIQSKVYKPISLKLGEGAATIIEIDHELKPIDLVAGDKYSEDVKKGERQGAMAAITLRVVDSSGVPVPGAELYGGFWNHDKDDPAATGMSDINGEIALVHNCTGDFNFSITKDTFSTFKFAYAPPDSGWSPSLELGMVMAGDRVTRNVFLGKDEYWVVDVRDRPGGRQFAVVSDFEYGGSDRGTNYCGVLLSYYLNPNPDDHNLESTDRR